MKEMKLDRQEFNLLVNDILLDVKPVKLRISIANRLIEFFDKKQERIAELEEQLKNMFTPKFKKGQEVWFVNNKTQIAPIKVIIGDLHFCWQSKNKFFYDGNMRLNFYEGIPENELFNTREEAQAKLEELK